MDRIYCGTLPKPELPDDDGSFKQKTTSDGFTYTARAVIAVGVHALRGSQCIEGWLEHTARGRCELSLQTLRFSRNVLGGQVLPPPLYASPAESEQARLV